MLNRISVERCRTQMVTDTLGAEYWSLPENSYLPLSSPKILKIHPNMPTIVVHNFASQPLAISDSKMVISLGFPVTVHPEIPANKELVN